MAWTDSAGALYVAWGGAGGPWEFGRVKATGVAREPVLLATEKGRIALYWAQNSERGEICNIVWIQGAWTKVDCKFVGDAVESLQVSRTHAGGVIAARVEFVGAWSAFVFSSGSRDGYAESAGNPSAPRLASDRSGRVVLAWEADGPGGRVIKAVVHDDAWSEPVTVAPAPASNPQLAMGSGNNGSAVLVWKRGPDASSTIWASYLGTGAGPAPGRAFKPRVVLAKKSAPARSRVRLVLYVKPRAAAAGQTVRIQAKGKGGAWVDLGRKQLNGNGAYAGVLKGPRKPAVMLFRAIMPDANGYSGATSPAVRLAWR